MPPREGIGQLFKRNRDRAEAEEGGQRPTPPDPPGGLRGGIRRRYVESIGTGAASSSGAAVASSSDAAAAPSSSGDLPEVAPFRRGGIAGKLSDAIKDTVAERGPRVPLTEKLN